MIAILLCAGYATRMYPLTRDFPKPLLPVAGKPVLDYLMDQIRGFEALESVHIITNDKFKDKFDRWRSNWLQEFPHSPFQLKVYNDGTSDNDTRLGASGDLAWLLKRLPPVDRMLVSAGDNLFRFPLKPLWNRFIEDPVHYILALWEADQKKLKKTGVITFGTHDQVIRVHEKPADPPSNWSCPAIYFFKGTAVPILNNFLKSSKETDAPGYFVDYLCQHDHVKAFKLHAARLDIGSIKSYHAADRMLKTEPVFQGSPFF